MEPDYGLQAQVHEKVAAERAHALRSRALQDQAAGAFGPIASGGVYATPADVVEPGAVQRALMIVQEITARLQSVNANIAERHQQVFGPLPPRQDGVGPQNPRPGPPSQYDVLLAIADGAFNELNSLEQLSGALLRRI